MRRLFLTFLLVILIAGQGVRFPVAQAQTVGGPGPTNSIVDVSGIRVGHWKNSGTSSGTTVIRVTNEVTGPASGGVDVRGGWPGTVETDLLDPRNLVHKLNGVVISGGSSAGLEARTGVMRCFEEAGEGFHADAPPNAIVPIVPGAIVHDQGRRGAGPVPDANSGFQACQSAGSSAPAQGNVGAGAGAVAGGIKGGFGSASVTLAEGIVVGAAVVVNTYGSPWRPDTCELYAGFMELENEFGNYKAPSQEECAQYGKPQMVAPGNAIAVVATNFALSKAQAQKMAGIGQDGLARVVRPSHTPFDGDVVFALSTGDVEAIGDCQANTPYLGPIGCAIAMNLILEAAGDTVSRAATHALLKARSNGSYKSYCDTFPSATCAPAAGQSTISLVGGVSDGSGAPSPRAGRLAPAVLVVMGSALILFVRKRLLLHPVSDKPKRRGIS